MLGKKVRGKKTLLRGFVSIQGLDLFNIIIASQENG
jgi:hypothetical protein